MREPNSLLNLSRRANSKAIKAAYWALAKQFNPDATLATRRAMHRR